MTTLRRLAPCAALLAAASCSDPTAPDELGARLSAWTPTAEATLARSTRLPSMLPRHFVVRDADTWRSCWELYFRDAAGAATLPPVDFEAEMALVAIGWSDAEVQVDSVVVYEKGARAYVTEWSRHFEGGALSCECGPGLAAHVVRMPRVEIADVRSVQRVRPR